MDKFILSQLIKELILEKGQVVLPGFGILSTKPVSASFSEDGRIINPPTQKMMFTENASIEDGLLVERYASKLNEPVVSLKKPLEAFIRELASEAMSGGAVELPGLGDIVFSEADEFSFAQDPEKDIFAERDGLEPIKLRIVEREEPEAIVPEKEPEATASQKESPVPEATPEITQGTMSAEREKSGIPITEEEAPTQTLQVEPVSPSDPVTAVKPEEPEPEQKEEPVIPPESEEPKPEQEPKVRHELEPADSRHRLFVVIIVFLGVIIIASILYILGYNGAFDTLLYTEEELEFMESLK